MALGILQIEKTIPIKPLNRAMRHVHCLFLIFLLGHFPSEPISPSEAAKKVGEKVTVEMEVKSVGRGKSGVFFLNSERNYKTDGNFTLFIGKAGAAKFRKAGIADPVAHFKDKKVRATGTVKHYKERPEIQIEEPTLLVGAFLLWLFGLKK